MPDIRCPHCGKVNPDFLDVCQFCQSPLKPESMLHIGEKPTKKNTGELENVLPDWLKDVRQQARNSSDEDTSVSPLTPKVQKEEPPDLLAGLAFQADNAEEEEVPDWLSRLSSTGKQERSIPPTPAPPENDFFAQFNKSEPAPKPEPKQEEPPAWMSGQTQTSSERDELSEWFTKAAEEPARPAAAEPDLSKIDSSWGLPAEPGPSFEQPAPKEEEDLSWLHNLEAESKKTGELSSPKQGDDWFAEISNPSTQPAGQDDLSWLNNLGSLPATDAEPSVPQSESKDDLSWLNDFGAAPVPNEPAQKPFEPKEDLSWLKNFDTTPPASEPTQSPSTPQDDLSWLHDFGAETPANEPAQQTPAEANDLSWLNNFGEAPANEQPAQPSFQSGNDLSWLDNFASTPTPQPAESNDLSWLNNFGAPSEDVPGTEPSKEKEDLSWLNDFSEKPEIAPSVPSPSASQEDLSWLNNLQGTSESLSPTPFDESSFEQDQPPSVTPQFTPRQTAPLNPDEQAEIPDWLKSATESPSMPLNAEQLDHFREDYKQPSAPEEPFSWKNFVPEARDEEEVTPPNPEPAFVDSNEFMPAPDASTLTNKDVDSLFSVDMPDWLSQSAPEETPQPTQDIGIHAEGGEALSPVDLPSWVQAMRPVEAVIAETAALDDQPAEQSGPLKGFKGVLPAIPIGSARRPQPIPLKLQATEEQQSSAAIMEQILASEMSPRAVISSPTFASQRALRQVIAFILLVVLGAVVFLRTQIMPISPVLPAEVDAVARTMEIVPDNSSVLVVVDYEPALAGELEAASGPVLNHLGLLRHPRLSFISTSSNGAGLVDRLIRNTSLNNPAGLAYTEGQNYFNLGYLPGGESGIMTFLQSPQSVSSFADPSGFSQYSAVILLTDHSDSARSWIEQLQTLKQADPSIVNQPLLVVSSAQAGPMLQPYVSSRQVNGMVNGLADAARYETKSNVPPGITRSYWDAFGIGVILAIALIVLGSLWSLFARLRASRAEAAEA